MWSAPPLPASPPPAPELFSSSLALLCVLGTNSCRGQYSGSWGLQPLGRLAGGGPAGYQSLGGEGGQGICSSSSSSCSCSASLGPSKWPDCPESPHQLSLVCSDLVPSPDRSVRHMEWLPAAALPRVLPSPFGFPQPGSSAISGPCETPSSHFCVCCCNRVTCMPSGTSLAPSTRLQHPQL